MAAENNSPIVVAPRLELCIISESKPVLEFIRQSNVVFTAARVNSNTVIFKGEFDPIDKNALKQHHYFLILEPIDSEDYPSREYEKFIEEITKAGGNSEIIPIMEQDLEVTAELLADALREIYTAASEAKTKESQQSPETEKAA